MAIQNEHKAKGTLLRDTSTAVDIMYERDTKYPNAPIDLPRKEEMAKERVKAKIKLIIEAHEKLRKDVVRIMSDY